MPPETILTPNEVLIQKQLIYSAFEWELQKLFGPHLSKGQFRLERWKRKIIFRINKILFKSTIGIEPEDIFC